MSPVFLFFVSLTPHMAVGVASLACQAVPHLRGGRTFLVKPSCSKHTIFFFFCQSVTQRFEFCFAESNSADKDLCMFYVKHLSLLWAWKKGQNSPFVLLFFQTLASNSGT